MVGFMVEQLLRKESAMTMKSGLGKWTWLLRREVLAALAVFVLDVGVGKRNKFRSFCQKFFHSQVNFSMGQGFLLRHLCLASRISSDVIKNSSPECFAPRVSGILGKTRCSCNVTGFLHSQDDIVSVQSCRC